jgi:hypothetical protein
VKLGYESQSRVGNSVSTKQTLARRWFGLVGSNRFGITLAAHRLGILPWSTRGPGLGLNNVNITYI